MSALEIYNETVQDLLVEPLATSGSSNLDIRQCSDVEGSETPRGGGSSASTGATWPPSSFGSLRVPGLRMRRIEGLQGVDEALRLIASNRRTASTVINNRSSRSHCVLSLSVVQGGALGSSTGNSGEMPSAAGNVGVGVLHIVDLAGSERTKVSHAEGQQLKEASAINKSLATLSDVLYALGEESPHVHTAIRS